MADDKKNGLLDAIWDFEHPWCLSEIKAAKSADTGEEKKQSPNCGVKMDGEAE